MNSFTKVRTYVALMAMFLMAMPCMAQSSQLTYRSGDVNGDGNVDVADIASIISIMAGNYVKDLTLSSGYIKLMEGYGGIVQIRAGSGFFKAESLFPDIAIAEIGNLKDGSFIVQISALKVGETDIVVSDEVTQQTQIVRVSVANEAEEIGGSYIDMGLPSGTLWATCNVGSDIPEGNGWYVSWGEIAEKDYYSWSNYWLFSAYNTTDLNDGQDVACVTLGDGWRMPTMAELEELLTCSWSWEMYNGVQGARITGPNGKSIFMPAATMKDGYATTPAEGTYGSYWGRTHANTVSWGSDGMVPCGAELVFGTADYKENFAISDFYYEMGPTGGCMVGRSVRPVYDENYKPNITDDVKNDYTSYIVNPTYNNNDYSGWEGTPLSGFNPDNNAEHYNKDYDTYQTISGLPKGTYRVGVQGFYRKGNSTNDYELWVVGDTENNNALLYAVSSVASASTPLAQASSAAIKNSLGGDTSSVGDGLYIPNNMEAASAWFKTNYYHNYLNVEVGDDGVLVIGIKKDVTIEFDWTIIDNWTLHLIGN